jgi:hypothetical protein
MVKSFLVSSSELPIILLRASRFFNAILIKLQYLSPGSELKSLSKAMP